MTSCSFSTATSVVSIKLYGFFENQSSNALFLASLNNEDVTGTTLACIDM